MFAITTYDGRVPVQFMPGSTATEGTLDRIEALVDAWNLAGRHVAELGYEFVSVSEFWSLMDQARTVPTASLLPRHRLPGEAVVPERMRNLIAAMGVRS